MPTIQLPYLDETLIVEENDLILTRRSAHIKDNRLKFSNLCKSIGNSSILGYKATVISNNDTEILLKLSPVNNIPIPYIIVDEYKHPDFPAGTLIFFTFPQDFKGNVSIEILNKTFLIISQKDNSSYFSCKENDYFVIKYTPINGLTDRFTRINDFDYLITNVYDVSEITTVNNQTTISLISTFGLQKEKYIKGMEIIFFSPETIMSNNILITIDELVLNKQVLHFADHNIWKTTIVKGQEVRAVYNGTKFIINSQDYPQLLPNFSVNLDYKNNYLIDFYNNYYDFIQTNYTYYTFLVDKNDSSANYTNLVDAIKDIEYKFGLQRQNIKIRLKIGEIELRETIIIDRDFSYIQIYPNNQNNQNIIIDCNALTVAFLIVKNGQFFSIAKDSVLYIKSTRTDVGTEQDPSGCNFIQIHNNMHNLFEEFTIIMGNFSMVRKIFTLFNIVYSGGGTSFKNISVRNDSAFPNQEKYNTAVVAGFYSSSIYFNNVRFYDREKNTGYGLLIGGVNWINETLTYTSYRHNIYMEFSDFRSKGDIADTTRDIHFLTNYTPVVRGFSTLNAIQTRGGTNIERPSDMSINSWYKITPSIGFFSTSFV